jgi:hypothetical protein
VALKSVHPLPDVCPKLFVHITCNTANKKRVSIANGYGLDAEGSEFSMLSRPILGPTQPPIQWVPGVLSPGQSGRVEKLTTHLQLVPRSRTFGSIYPFSMRLHGVVLN